jgi:hypothetical protein
MANRKARRRVDSPASGDLVKLTLRLPRVTAQRLGVASVMTAESQSAIVARVLAAHLAGWRLPSNLGTSTVGTVDPDQPGEPAPPALRTAG